MARKTVAALLVDVLVDAGVERACGVPGDSLNGITALRWELRVLLGPSLRVTTLGKALGNPLSVSGQSSVNAKSSSDSAEWLVSCPQKGGRIEKDGGDQLCVGQTNANTV